MSSAERWKMKKAGIVDPNAALVTELTELANSILTKMGNMDVYEETYEEIHGKYSVKSKTGESSSSSTAATATSTDDALDMYADDFDVKEQSKKITKINDPSTAQEPATEVLEINGDILWEFKWKTDDSDVHGPFSTAQMLHWSKEGYFKGGVYVKKVGHITTFNTSNRIDFELYL